MSQEERVAINRANAQHSTGPKTPEGKARSSQNARKHGLTARELVLRPDEREEFEEFLADLTEELQPQGALEQVVFNQLVHAAWNLRRARRVEADQPVSKHDPLWDTGPFYTRLGRYHAHIERSFYRALKELKALQTNRVLARQAQVPEAPPLVVIAELTKRTAPPSLRTLFPPPVPPSPRLPVSPSLTPSPPAA